MRIRRKKHAVKRMNDCVAFWATDPESNCGKWLSKFPDKKPLHIEIGCGKGGFITTLAQMNPDIAYVAIERERDCIVIALEKACEMKLDNILFILGDAQKINEYFAPGECSRIYLNFSDPWPKSRHIKRRLTHRDTLQKYSDILDSTGDIIVKTDNQALFEYSIMEFNYCGYDIAEKIYDLHNSDIKDNIVTEYEERFSSLGYPICFCRAVKTQPEE